jgi:hypothetical protein
VGLTESPMVHHQATILHNFDSGLSKFLRDRVVTDA